MSELKMFNIRISAEDKEALRGIAKRSRRSMAEQIRFWIDHAEAISYRIVDIDALPGPADAQVVPVVTIEEKPQEG